MFIGSSDHVHGPLAGPICIGACLGRSPGPLG